jgi:hypothetical protein
MGTGSTVPGNLVVCTATEAEKILCSFDRPFEGTLHFIAHIS